MNLERIKPNQSLNRFYYQRNYLFLQHPALICRVMQGQNIYHWLNKYLTLKYLLAVRFLLIINIFLSNRLLNQGYFETIDLFSKQQNTFILILKLRFFSKRGILKFSRVKDFLDQKYQGWRNFEIIIKFDFLLKL